MQLFFIGMVVIDRIFNGFKKWRQWIRADATVLFMADRKLQLKLNRFKSGPRFSLMTFLMFPIISINQFRNVP